MKLEAPLERCSNCATMEARYVKQAERIIELEAELAKAADASLARLERMEKVLREARKLLPGGDGETVLGPRLLGKMIDEVLRED